MTQDEIIALLEKAKLGATGSFGFLVFKTVGLKELTDFANLVAAKALAQPEQKPPPWWTAVENILNEYGLQAIDFVADFKQALAQTQEPKIGCVNHDCDKCKAQKACVYCGQLVAKENT